MPQKTGAELIADERMRQVNDCGWTASKDDEQTDGEILKCAIDIAEGVWVDDDVPSDVPMDDEDWPTQRAERVIMKYGKDHVKRLAIAGALIAAEIDRLQRELVAF